MKRALLVATIVALTSFGSASMASAQTNQPGQGANSTGRNEAGFGEGPHCHVLIVENAQDRFEFIRVFPSHTGHANSGLVDGVFAADIDCNGVL